MLRSLDKDTKRCVQYSFYEPLGVDEVSMLTHTYPHKPQRKIKVTIYAIARMTANFLCGLTSDLVICKFRKSRVIYDTECPYWDQV